MGTLEETIALSEKIGGLTTTAEKTALWNLGMKHIQPYGVAIEVGTWTGGSAVILGEICRRKNARLICIDAFSADMHSIGDGVKADAFHSVLKNCHDLPIDYMCGDSIKFVNYLVNDLADFIFVDGDHHHPRVDMDIHEYWNKLKFGGCYFIHDYTNPCDVKEVVDSFFLPEQLVLVDSSVYVIKI